MANDVDSRMDNEIVQPLAKLSGLDPKTVAEKVRTVRENNAYIAAQDAGGEFKDPPHKASAQAEVDKENIKQLAPIAEALATMEAQKSSPLTRSGPGGQVTGEDLRHITDAENAEKKRFESIPGGEAIASDVIRAGDYQKSSRNAGSDLALRMEFNANIALAISDIEQSIRIVETGQDHFALGSATEGNALSGASAGKAR